MPEPPGPAELLGALVEAAREGRMVIFGHAWDRFAEDERPNPSDVWQALGEDAPRIIHPGEPQADPRGRTAQIEGEALSGQTVRVVLNYDRRPPVLVTAYYVGFRP